MSRHPRLSRATLGLLPDAVGRPAALRRGVAPGVVHFGPGAFHRAHQAAYFDALLRTDPRWSIAEVALNSTGVADALAPQDGLYVLARLGAERSYGVIGSIAELLTARRDPGAIVARIASAETRLITSTVTEKGYCLTAAGQLDEDHPGIVRDRAATAAPETFIGWLVAGLSARRAGGGDGLTVLPCDNLAGNGRRLGRAVHRFAELRDPALAGWIAERVAFPSSMVDSITPASDAALRADVASATGLEDAWPVRREPFAQWVIEDRFAGERPALDAVGAQFVRDVAPFEEAKLRLLNAAHSSLAYLGLLLGHATVAEAMGDDALARYVEAMMREDIAPTLAPLEGLPLDRYVSDVLDRFRNPGIRHRLAQIAWDGSQKLPVRLLSTAAARRRAGAPPGRLAGAIAAWLRFLGLPRVDDDGLVDPLKDLLAPLARAANVEGLLAIEAVFPADLAGDAPFRAAVVRAYRAIGESDGVRGVLGRAA